MTVKEIIDGLKFTIDMFLFDPTTGETFTEPRNDMDKTTIDACKGAIELLEKTQWIPVSERLPKEDEWVLITFDDGIEIASLDDAGWCYSSVGNDDWIAEHPPVAWMPLPQPHQPEIPIGAEGSEE